MASLTEFRVALQEHLSQTLQIPFRSGMIIGPVPNAKALGCTWCAGKNEVQGQVNDEDIVVMVRVYLRYQMPADEEHPVDPAPLEKLAEQLQRALASRPTGIGPWMQRVASIEIEPLVQGVEATIVARQPNLGAVGG